MRMFIQKAPRLVIVSNNQKLCILNLRDSKSCSPPLLTYLFLPSFPILFRIYGLVVTIMFLTPIMTLFPQAISSFESLNIQPWPLPSLYSHPMLLCVSLLYYSSLSLFEIEYLRSHRPRHYR